MHLAWLCKTFSSVEILCSNLSTTLNNVLVCSLNCQNDWFNDFGDRAINHFGRLTEPKHLTEDNAWVKDYDWRIDDRQNAYFYVNKISKERRPLTEEQYRDNNYTINIES